MAPLSFLAQNEFEQRGDLSVLLRRVAERQVGMYFVVVMASVVHSAHVARVLEFCQDALYAPFGNTHPFSYVANAHLREMRHTQEDMGVIGKERPRRDGIVRLWT